MRADDAGLARSVNLAIVEALGHKLLRNVSIMAVGPEVEHAASIFSGTENAALGLHLTLNCEWDHPRWGPCAPACSVPSLVNGNGHFLSTTTALHERNAPMEEVVREAEAQLRRLRGLGLKLSYIDDHMGVTWIPGIKEAIYALACREGLIFVPADFNPLPACKGLEASKGLAARLIKRLEAVPSGVYTNIFHPAFEDPEMVALTLPGRNAGEIARERDADRRLLCDADFADFLNRSGMESVCYDDLFVVGDRLENPS